MKRGTTVKYIQATMTPPVGWAGECKNYEQKYIFLPINVASIFSRRQLASTVKLGCNELGCNELGYNEHSVITSTRL